MRRIILLTITALCVALQVMTAQTKSNDNFKFHKATEILDEGGDPREARKLAMENIKENPGHIESYLLVAGMDRKDEDYASALGIVELAMKNNRKNSGFSIAILLWWKGIIYNEIGDTKRAVGIMEEVVRLARK